LHEAERNLVVNGGLTPRHQNDRGKPVAGRDDNFLSPFSSYAGALVTEMICRIWHGWTTHANSDTYERLLREEVFVGIHGRHIAGFHGIELLRRPLTDEVEFSTMMWFDSLEAVRTFAGEDYEVAVVPPAARAVLSHFDPRSAHYEVRIPRGSAGPGRGAPTVCGRSSHAK
jgi:hypothetical protein